MSASAGAVHELPHHSRSAEPAAFRLLAAGVIALTALVIGGGLMSDSSAVGNLWILVWWSLLVTVVNLLPVESERGPLLAMDMPVLLGVAFAYGPVAAGMVAFCGSLDVRELRRQVSITRALYNRAQTSLSVMAAGLTFVSCGGQIGRWPQAALAALASVAADSIVNYPLAGLATALTSAVPLGQVLARMRFGPPQVFVPVYAGFGFLGLLLAESYVRLGIWGPVAFVVPVLLARQTFAAGRDLDKADRTLRGRRKVLRRVGESIADERRDERTRIATSLHDDVLQSLYNVTLHAQVIREDLRAGRLLDLDGDLPALIRASDEASGGLRAVIRDLRKSPLGRAGLVDTLLLLVQDLREQSVARIDVSVESVELSPDSQLLMYQIAREALMNAIQHSGAGTIRLLLGGSDAHVDLRIEDDGAGFHPEMVDQENHFGLQLMRERADAAGGSLTIESRRGAGTVVRARFPRGYS